MRKRKENWLPPHDGKKRCRSCGGTGEMHYTNPYNLKHSTCTCMKCGGRGYK